MGVNEGNLLVSHGGGRTVHTYKLQLWCTMVEIKSNCESGRRNVPRQSVWVTVYKGLRRTGGGDQADIFNLIQNSCQNTGVHLKVVEEQ